MTDVAKGLSALKELGAAKLTPSKTIEELRKHLASIIREKQSNIQSWANDGNPQIVESRKIAQAELEFAQAVERALRGDFTDIRMI